MRTTRLLLALAAGLALAIAPAGIAVADGHDDDEDSDDRRLHFAKEGGDKWLLRNENLGVWFHQGKNGHAKPQLRVFHADEDGNVSGYSVDVKRILEIGPKERDHDEDDDEDEDEEDAPEMEIFNAMKLSRSEDWNVRTTETNTTLTITMVRAEAQAIVTLVFHVDKTSPHVKFDLEVENWDWADDATNHTLALVMVVHEKDFTRRDGTHVTLDGGYVSWASTATVTDGPTSRTVNVTANVDEDEDDKGRITLVFDTPGGFDKLVYDPEFGVQSTSTTERGIPAAPVAFALAAVAVVALAVRRRGY